ncbi:MAG TPA: hypothetical protein VNT99_14450 [Methylomirabilota bacterium]|nr:hypothetical protein [Methylomirabilota bacterium]
MAEFLTHVVDRDPTAGVLLDFYYQILNTTEVLPPTSDSEIWRFQTIGGFSGLALSVAHLDISPSTGLAIVGLQPARTADRDEGSPGSVGFEFSPLNIAAGEASTFLVIRTDAMHYEDVTAVISGAGTSFAETFGATASATSVPDTGGTLVFGLTLAGICLAGICLAGYRRKPAVVTK